MKTVNLILCVLNVLFLIFNIYTQHYSVAAINGLAVFFTAGAALIDS